MSKKSKNSAIIVDGVPTGTARGYVMAGAVAHMVTVKATLHRRLPRVEVVGLSAGQARETAERVRSAIEAAGLTFPRMRVVLEVVEPMPTAARTTALDLAFAAALLRAMGVVPGYAKPAHQGYGDLSFFGELSLSGQVRRVRGVSAAAQASHGGSLVCARGSEDAVAMSSDGIIEIDTVLALQAVLTDPMGIAAKAIPAPQLAEHKTPDGVLPWALALAASRKHPVVLIGRGAVKLAHDARHLLTGDMNAVRVWTTREAAGLEVPGDRKIGRPFRAPHHTCSLAGLVGGRQSVGEYQLASGGVLLLDEVTQVSRAALEALMFQMEGDDSGDRPWIIAASAEEPPPNWWGWSEFRPVRLDAAGWSKFRPDAAGWSR